MYTLLIGELVLMQDAILPVFKIRDVILKPFITDIAVQLITATNKSAKNASIYRKRNDWQNNKKKGKALINRITNQVGKK